MKILLVIASLLVTQLSFAQSYEGSITYKMEMLNPMPEQMTDSMWTAMLKEKFGEKGHIVQKYYYKGATYMSEVDAGVEQGFQLYSPEEGLLYNWQKGEDEAITFDTKQNDEKLKKIIENNGTLEILGITCQSITLKTSFSEITLWYNPEYFPMDASLYKGHVYGFYEQSLEKMKCLPLKIEMKSGFTHTIQTMTSFEEGIVEAEKFVIPTFEKVTSM